MTRRDPIRAIDSRFERADYMLAAIAAVFLTGVGVAELVPSSSTLAVSVSALVSLGLIGELLFHNPPQTAELSKADSEGQRPAYLRNVEYDSGCVEVWDHLSEVRYGA